MKFITKVSKIGNSLYAIIPKMIADASNIKVDDMIEIDPIILIPSNEFVDLRCNDCNFEFENQRGIDYWCPNCNSSNICPDSNSKSISESPLIESV